MTNYTVLDYNWEELKTMHQTLCEYWLYFQPGQSNGSFVPNYNIIPMLEDFGPRDFFGSCTILGNYYKNCGQFFTSVVTGAGMCYSFNLLHASDLFRDDV